MNRKNCVQQLCSHQRRNWPWAPQCCAMLRVTTRSVESAGGADASKSKGWRWWPHKHLGGGNEATWWSMLWNQLRSAQLLADLSIFPTCKKGLKGSLPTPPVEWRPGLDLNFRYASEQSYLTYKPKPRDWHGLTLGVSNLRISMDFFQAANGGHNEMRQRKAIWPIAVVITTSMAVVSKTAKVATEN